MGNMQIKLPLHHLKEVAFELNLALYPSRDVGNIRIKLPLPHLDEVACELNLSSLFGACAIILKQYMFSLRFELSTGICSFNLCVLLLYSLWSLRFYLERMHVQSVAFLSRVR